MTVRLELKPEVEASLAARAKAKGLALDAYLQEVIEALARSEVAPSTNDADLKAVLWMPWPKWAGEWQPCRSPEIEQLLAKATNLVPPACLGCRNLISQILRTQGIDSKRRCTISWAWRIASAFILFIGGHRLALARRLKILQTPG